MSMNFGSDVGMSTLIFFPCVVNMLWINYFGCYKIRLENQKQCGILCFFLFSF